MRLLALLLVTWYQLGVLVPSVVARRRGCGYVSRRIVNETLHSWPIVLTGVVLSRSRDKSDGNQEIVKLHVKRVYSGREYVDGGSEIDIHGFTKAIPCSVLARGSVRVFPLTVTGNHLYLAAAPLRVSLHALDLLHALSTGRPIRKRRTAKPTVCETKRCPFGSRCSHPTGSCDCRSTCRRALFSQTVCGSDHVSYASLCHLSVRACVLTREKGIVRRVPEFAAAPSSDPLLRVLHYGECRKQNPCAELRCGPGEECIPTEKDGILSASCSCPSHCPSYGDSVDSSPVCSSDGDDYPSLCKLRVAACQTKRNITLKFFGKCDPCASVTCQPGTVCKVEEGTRKAQCRCSKQCTFDDEPVCATDGKTYQNECLMSVEACRSDRELAVYRRGPCNDSTPCTALRCHWGQSCVIDVQKVIGKAELRDIPSLPSEDGESVVVQDVARCECAQGCPQVMKPVCGADDRTYDSECELLREACVHRRRNHVKHQGPCGHGLCSSFPCAPPQICRLSHDKTPVCACPECPDEYSPVCASDGRTYPNECKMRRASCVHGGDALFVRYNNECAGCSSLSCSQLYTECISDIKGTATCQCPECPVGGNTTRESAVCGTNGVTYSSLCHLQAASCRSGVFIAVAFSGKCDSCQTVECGYGEECRGGKCECAYECDEDDDDSNRVSPRSGHEEVCGSDGVIYSSRCRLALAACRKKAPISAVPLLNCHSAMAERRKGDKEGGIKEDCGCNPIGAYGSACDREGQCRCRPGVGGKICDHCSPGFWGIHLIAKGRTSCTPCGCSVFGSSRADCEQSSGVCECKPGVRGERCTSCITEGHILTPRGCIPKEERKEGEVPCNVDPCVHGAECRSGRCVCPLANSSLLSSCDHSYAPLGGGVASTMPVCGSDRRSYDNACHLERHACLRQLDLVPISLGLCSEDDDSPPTTTTAAAAAAPTTIRPSTPSPTGGRVTVELGTSPPKIKLGSLCEDDQDCKEIALSSCLLRSSDRGSCECSLATRQQGEECVPIVTESIDRRLEGGLSWRRKTTIRPNVTITFSPSSSDGFILHVKSTDRRHDFSLSSELGKLIVKLDGERIESENELAKNTPNSISILFHSRSIHVQMGSERITRRAKERLEIAERVLFGGSDDGDASIGGCLLSAFLNGDSVRKEDLEGEEMDETCHQYEERLAAKEEEKLQNYAMQVDLTAHSALLSYPDVRIDVRNAVSIRISLRPSTPDGLLFFWGRPMDSGKSPDFLALFLIAYQPTFFWNLGSGIAYVKAKALDTHRWSSVSFGRDLKNGSIQIDDGLVVQGQSPGKLVHLDIQGETVHLGGIPSLDLLPPRLRTLKDNYSGHVSSLSINDRPFPLHQKSLWSDTVVEGTETPCEEKKCGVHGVCQTRGNDHTCKCQRGWRGERCVKEGESEAAFFDGSKEEFAYLNRVNQSVPSSTRSSFSFSLKTFSTDGHIWWEAGADDYFLLFLREGQMHVVMNLGNDASLKPVNVRGVRVNDGGWHKVDVKRDFRNTTITVDGRNPLWIVASPGSSELNTDGLVYLGGRYTPAYSRFQLPGTFVGCIKEVMINDRSLDVRMDSISEKVPAQCRL
ncbi:hypothetical protein PENTCL1PPCAC_6006 [Pristionchus entomophagus]|uniref:Agrin n=1 Tax=Pristionchus entomophagus TaxID=358040 RepID=A0AAV5SKG5_9BILA|nr:hypothetical protein PENTCL1PPCAC_6006 [Pristionchus entomophagus]